ncbi:surfeit locus 1 family protein [Solimonas aquatica]|uniref:SURF1-like protein n=1 Tax=Solimonas aquatica TaxID=489703 RepID=A0A1H9IWF7_9GAMM|nr:SURF1 family protein [Solimonas aquatica]SEQ78943.1 surfeit locus 1 family protein [Solimonas aquatica]
MTSPGRRRVLALGLLLLCAAFLALGSWQLQRRAWKLDLIARVEARVHAMPTPVHAQADWARLDARAEEYRRLQLSGELLAQTVFTQAVTERGPGFWVLSPLRLSDGSVVLINRGYVDAAHREFLAGQGFSQYVVTGLLRRSEPGGGFLRDNDPAAGRWHSRDVAAISSALKLDAAHTAPFFVDAEAMPTQDWPVGGLTVIRFHNSHLVYALTWFGLAGLSLLGLWLLYREPERR